MLLPSTLLPLCSLLQTKKFLLPGFSSVYQIWLLSAPIPPPPHGPFPHCLARLLPVPTGLPSSLPALLALCSHSTLEMCAAEAQHSLFLKFFLFLRGATWNIWSPIDSRQEDSREKKEPSYASRKCYHETQPCFPSEGDIQAPRKTACNLHPIRTDCCLSNLYKIKDFPS